jgi:hypothetical protein
MVVQRTRVSGVNSSHECRGESRWIARRGNLGMREITASRVQEPGDQVVVWDPYIVVDLFHFPPCHTLLNTFSLQHY